MTPQTYNEYRYLYPPRPEHRTGIKNIGDYNNNDFIAQPKYNGSACVLFMNDSGFLKIMNRHNEELTLVKHDQMDFMGAYRGSGFMVLCGELLNKNKKGEDGQPFNQKLIIWDVLVYNGLYMIGTATEERLEFLEQFYPCNRSSVTAEGIEMYKHLCCTGIKGIYKAPTYNGNFARLYQDIVKTDVYEGLLLKRAKAKLSYGFSSSNNSDWQIKIRKETKNYNF